MEVFLQYILLEKEEARFLSIVRDIRGRLEQEREKEKLQARLLHAQKLESVGQLAAGIAHEINTPTQFIGTNIDFMEESVRDLIQFMSRLQELAKELPEELQEKIHAALEEADWDYLAEELPLAMSQSREGVERVSTIVRAMKEFSHPGSRDKEKQNLNHIIKTTVTVTRNEWKYVAEVELDLDPELPEIPLLADDMGQVILNMLVNSAQAIAEKLGKNPQGEKGTILIRTRTVEGDWNCESVTVATVSLMRPGSISSILFTPPKRWAREQDRGLPSAMM